jgi:hypothetical protein
MNSGDGYVPAGYIDKLEAENIRLKEVIKSRNETISKLKLMLRPFGIEITGMYEDEL